MKMSISRETSNALDFMFNTRISDKWRPMLESESEAPLITADAESMSTF